MTRAMNYSVAVVVGVVVVVAVVVDNCHSDEDDVDGNVSPP